MKCLLKGFVPTLLGFEGCLLTFSNSVLIVRAVSFLQLAESSLTSLEVRGTKKKPAWSKRRDWKETASTELVPYTRIF